MKFKLIGAFAIIATIVGSSYSVNAQSQVNRSNQGYTLSGDSLTGINQRTSQGDFRSFFGELDYIDAGGNQKTNWQLNNGLPIKVNSPLGDSTRTRQNFRTRDNFDGINKVEIQLNTDE